jgi:hypothetical protein
MIPARFPSACHRRTTLPSGPWLAATYRFSAGNDIKRTTLFNGEEVPDSSHQITSNWLYRRGYVDPATGKFGAINYKDSVTDSSASTAWWVDHSNFFQGFAALGGGNVRLSAGQDIVNADAVAPTSARMAGVDSEGKNLAPSAANLLEHGGGDVIVQAGRNIDGGLYYVENGNGQLSAGGEIKTNNTRSPSLGILGGDGVDPVYESELSWLPTTLVLGKGGFDVSARGNVLLGPVVNPFLLPAGLRRTEFWYKTYFSTYSPDSHLDIASLGGSITLRNSVIYSSETGPQNAQHAWMLSQNLFPSVVESSSLQPWTRLAESDISAFNAVLNLAPPTLRAVAFSGAISTAGDITLSPAPKGNLELLAKESLNGLNPIGKVDGVSQWISSRINLSDAALNLIPNVTSPLAYYSLAPENKLYTSKGSFLSSFDEGLSESGSVIGADASIALKLKRHGTSLLHAADENPARLYAKNGSISGLAVFTPKMSNIVAGADITDSSFYLQNVAAKDVSIVSAGGEIVLQQKLPQRSLAKNLMAGNALYKQDAATPDKDAWTQAGDIQMNGPGVLEVLAGRNLDLGSAPSFVDGTGAGIKSIGNTRNPNLPFAGASIIALAGVQDKNGSAAFGLAGSNIAFDKLAGVKSTTPATAPLSDDPEQIAITNLSNPLRHH